MNIKNIYLSVFPETVTLEQMLEELKDILLFAIILISLAFLCSLPGRLKKEKRVDAIKNAKIGDTVVTHSGMTGTIVSHSAGTFEIQMIDATRARFAEWGIKEVKKAE